MAQNLIRSGGRLHDELRPVRFERDFTKMTPGSVLSCYGDTHVLCTVSYDPDVPPWMRHKGAGWITSEYSLLPGSTDVRAKREASSGKLKGRTQEIQRLIGRSLRAVSDLSEMGECALFVDCDVLQADGGTRTAAISGACLALHDASTRLLADGKIKKHPLTQLCAAISVGMLDGAVLLDLEYAEDHRAEVDMNVVMTEAGSFVEVQGTAEKQTFDSQQLTEMISIAGKGIAEILDRQREYLAQPLSKI